jgi:hypothetical protein
MQKSSFLSKKLFGSIYKTTVPSAQRWWEFAMPQFLHSDPDGMDGTSTELQKHPCRAQHKPHAVIANGNTLLLVPSSLRMLQKVCRDANVPLFVIRDPRAWGGNTHDNFPSMLKDLQKTVKHRIVEQALRLDGWSAFKKGRILGQTETEAKWLLKDRVRKAKGYLSRRNDSSRKEESSSIEDWSNLDAAQLEEKLARHNLVQKLATDGNENAPSTISCSESLRSFLQKCTDKKQEK